MEIAREAAANIGGDGTQDYRVRAIVARMNKQYKAAEKIYMQMVKKFIYIFIYNFFFINEMILCLHRVSFALVQSASYSLPKSTKPLSVRFASLKFYRHSRAAASFLSYLFLRQIAYSDATR